MSFALAETTVGAALALPFVLAAVGFTTGFTGTAFPETGFEGAGFEFFAEDVWGFAGFFIAFAMESTTKGLRSELCSVLYMRASYQVFDNQVFDYPAQMPGKFKKFRFICSKFDCNDLNFTADSIHSVEWLNANCGAPLFSAGSMNSPIWAETTGWNVLHEYRKALNKKPLSIA